MAGVMATLSHAQSRRMYSWWWDSHISPKNSKWLQENLTDMDSKVKQMIKLIEEDADSFARRAEMYYKKRPELMKMVEEFYRAYRALAERYDNATGVIRHAHKTMAEVFPNQMPMGGVDDSPASSAASDGDPHTPEMPHPTRALFDPDELHKDALGLSSSHFQAVKKNGAFTEESDSITSRKGLKQLNGIFGSGESTPPTLTKFGEGRVKKGLNFNDAEEKEQPAYIKARGLFESDRGRKSQTDIINLKEALAKLEAEKEAGRLQYQQSLERLSNLESEVSRAQEDSRGLNERASKAEAEVQTLKEALRKLDAEGEASLIQYQQSLDRISNLENSVLLAEENAGKLTERASYAESEALAVKHELSILEADKEAVLVQYNRCLETISDLEKKLLQAEEDARRIHEQADKAESEVETLKQALAKLTEEKEAAALQYQQCLETISSLESKLSGAQEEAKRLNSEISDGVAKLKSAEEHCLQLETSNQSLQSELESLVQKMGTQGQELTEKQQELGSLWTCIQEERSQFMEIELAFQALQHLHSQSQEELRSLAAEFQNRAQVLKGLEIHNHVLQDEVQKAKEENRSLNELNLASAVSIKNMQDELASLREAKRKLQEEVDFRVDQRNALQQEIYCLKEEINDLNRKHQAVLEQVESVGLNSESFGSSVKELQDKNSKLDEVCQRERNEKAALLEKLEIMESLIEKNAVLENSLSDLSLELEAVREKVKALEESCELLLGEKSAIVAEKTVLYFQLQTMIENLQKLSEKNTFIENSLFDANAELEGLREKLKSLEDTHHLLDTEKSGLITERVSLVSQLQISQQSLEDLEKRYTDSEEKYTGLEKENESTLSKVEELRVSLDVEKQEHAKLTQLSANRLAGLESQICVLEEESQRREKEYEEELDKAANAQIEIFILQECVKDVEEQNFFLSVECQKLLETSERSEKLISELEHEKLEQQMEVKSLFDQIKTMRLWMYQVLKSLEVDSDHGCEDKIERDLTHMDHILVKLEDKKDSHSKTLDENLQLVLEKSLLLTVLGQLRLEAIHIETEKNNLYQDLKIKIREFLALQSENHKLMEMNEELQLSISDKEHKNELQTTEIENLQANMFNLQGAYQNLQQVNSKALEENGSLMKEFLGLKEENHKLEEENCVISGEATSLSYLSLIFKNIFSEKALELKELGENLDRLHGVNNGLEEKVRLMEGSLVLLGVENHHLKESMEKSENELKTVVCVSDQLNNEIANGKEVLHQKEVELLEAGERLRTLENEQMELQNLMGDLKRKFDEVMVIKEDQEKQIHKLSEDNDNQNKESELLRDMNLSLEAKLLTLQEEHKETKVKEENLSSQLEKWRTEAELWETGATTLFGELQISNLHEALFAEKIHELTEACQSLEDKSNSKGMDIELLKERIGTLEDKYGGLEGQLAAYFPVINSLEGSIASLENYTLKHSNLHKADNEETKDDKSVSHLQAENCSEQKADLNAKASDGFSDLQGLETRIKAIEKALMEKERIAAHENVERSRHVGSQQGEEKHGDGLYDDSKLRKSTHAIHESGNELLTKDIMLDQVSECSSYGIGRRETTEADDQMLELWETTDQNGSINLKVGKTQKPAAEPATYHQIKAVEKDKRRHPSSEIMVEKELGVDKLEISKRFAEPRQEGSSKKILERLASDSQKLANLQITVQDLKKKVEITEKSKKGNGIEYGTVKEQLEEAEEAVLQLFETNSKLMKNAEDTSLLPSEGKSVDDSDEYRSIRRRRISEQARRGSEKIGRLQLEVQKLQFLLLKLDDDKESKGKTRIRERSKRVLLRDYLYGGTRTSHIRKNKAPFCACVRPPTKA